MQITIQIPDGVTTEVVNSFVHEYGWRPQIPNPNGEGFIDNPVDKTAFARQMIRRLFIQPYIEKTARATYDATKTSTENLIG